MVIKCHHEILEGVLKTGFEIYGAIFITMIFTTIEKYRFLVLLRIFVEKIYYHVNFSNFDPGGFFLKIEKNTSNNQKWSHDYHVKSHGSKKVITIGKDFF
jgi:hypothetical protein